MHAKVDTEAEQQLAAMAHIRSIPTSMAFREGGLVYSQSSALPAPALRALITRIEALDMAEIHTKVAEQRAASHF